MDIKELINGLLDFNQNYEALCAENKDLIAENKALKEKIKFITGNSKKAQVNNVAKVALKNGEYSLLEDCLYNWYTLKVKYNTSENAFQCVVYEAWLEDKVIKDNLPNTVSFYDFVTYFSKKLHAMYEEEKAEGIEALKKSMENDKEKESK